VALFNWWTDGAVSGGSRALAGPVPDNYVVVDTSLSGATSSVEEGGSMASWTDAWQGSGRPSFFYFDPALTLVDHLTASDMQHDYSQLSSLTSPIIDTMAAAWTGCIAGDTFCDEVPGGETIVIGGSDGWVVKPANAPYDTITANVGDTLQFTYSSFYHDVMLVDNENCDFTNGQMVDETGDFAWTIPEPGTYVFACTRGDHCSVGNQQVTVIVGGGDDSTGPDTDPCGDVDTSGLVDVSDLLIVLSQFGQTDVLTADINFDGTINVEDLLLVLSQFGGSC
jgi:plastocyanin